MMSPCLKTACINYLAAMCMPVGPAPTMQTLCQKEAYTIIDAFVQCFNATASQINQKVQ